MSSQEPAPGASQGSRLDPPTPYAVPHIFSGRVCFVMVRTDADLRPFVPYPLVPADDHRAFLKVYQLKYRPVGGRPKPPGFSQYLQVCLCVLAAPPGEPMGHYNLMLWELREWSLGGSEPYGWRKKLASVEVTSLFPTPDRYDVDDGTDWYQAEVHQFGRPIVELRAELSGGGCPDPGLAAGFYSVRYRDDGSPIDQTATAEVTRITVEEPYLGPPISGQGSLRILPGIGYSPEEVAMLDAFADLEVEGVVLRDIGWRRDAPQSQTFIYPGNRS